MIINHNMNAMNAHRQMMGNTSKAGKAMEKLSSGLRINRAGDDAAGLAISEKMRGQIRGLDQAARNSQDAISMIQTGEGALNETQSILQRMRELATQSSNDTNIATDRKQIQGEIDQLAKEITRISNDTEFNQQNLLGGNLDDTFHVGANKDQNISLKINAMDAFSLGVAGDTNEVKGTIKTNADIESVNFENSTGDKVKDGKTLTFAHKNVSADAKAKITGKSNFTSADLSGKTGTITITVNGKDYSLDADAVKKWDNKTGHATAADAKTFLEGAKATDGTTLGSVATVSGTTKLAIEANSIVDGDKVAVKIEGTDKTDIVGVFGFADTGNTEVSGAHAGDFITVSNGTDSKDFAVDKTKTTFSTGSDSDFGGVTLEMASNKTLNDLDATGDTVALKVTTTSSSAMSSDGKTKAIAAAGIDVSTQKAANSAIETINDAIETVSTERSKLGAFQNRLEHTIANLNTSSENLQASESRIRDVDMAKEMMTFSKNNILSQAAQAMLAQANQQPQGVLQLLR